LSIARRSRGEILKGPPAAGIVDGWR